MFFIYDTDVLIGFKKYIPAYWERFPTDTHFAPLRIPSPDINSTVRFERVATSMRSIYCCKMIISVANTSIYI